MKRRKNYLLSLATAGLVTSIAAAPEIDHLQQEAVGIVKRFASTLKPALIQAIEQGGPVAAIDVCSQRAPQIAADLSAETGWIVRRVSAKPRNQSLAVPDEWERSALQKLAARAEAGNADDPLVIAEIDDGQFRLIKGQVVEALCLTCHGSSIPDEVATAIRIHYPDDTATGYELGQLRGAISLRKPISP